MKLISMTDFVIRLNQNKNYVDENGNMPFYHTAINHYQNSNRSEDYRCLVRYANFLKQHLKLEMFVPCSDNGNILDDPGLIPSYELEQYRKAKEKVLFEGFTVLSEEDDVIELECNDIFISYNKEEDLFSLDSWNNDALITHIECLVNLINYTSSSINLTKNAIKTIKGE